MYRYRSEQNSQFSSPPLLYNLRNLLSALLRITASTLDFAHSITMAPATYSHQPSEVLHQLSRSMDGLSPELSVQLPVSTTWKTALKATEEALGNIDQPVMMLPKRFRKPSQRLREMAARDAVAASSSDNMLPIRTNVDVAKLPMPPRPWKPLSEKWKEYARQSCEFRQPYPVTIRADITERTLPVITGSISLNGINEESDNEAVQLAQVEMLWDTGAHRTIVALELLPKSFQEYLKKPTHDPYRVVDATQVQVDMVVALSNCTVLMRAIAWVVPKSKIPNERVGVLFGQLECINRLQYESIPASILSSDGEDLEDNVWGDLILKRYLNEDDEIVTVEPSE